LRATCVTPAIIAGHAAAARLALDVLRRTLLVHLSDEDGDGWTVLAVDRATRHWAVAQSRRQRDAAEDAYSRLYADAAFSGP
jgi:hypothetical protein